MKVENMITNIRDLPDFFNEETQVYIDMYPDQEYIDIIAFTVSYKNVSGPKFRIRRPTSRDWISYYMDYANKDRVVVIKKELYEGTGQNKSVTYGRLKIVGFGREERIKKDTPAEDLAEPEQEKPNENKQPGFKKKLDDEFKKVYEMLNEKQKQIVDYIALDPLQAGNIFITGGPGTGKTFVTRALVLKLKQHNIMTTAIAPSHKAKNVLSRALDQKATTIASHCGYAMSESNNPKVDISGEFIKERETQRATVAIVDEVSMVSSENMEEIIENTSLFVVALGDKNQLKTIKGDQADLSKLITFELTEQMRQDSVNTALYKNIQLMRRKVEGSNEPVVFQYDETFIRSDNLVNEFLNKNVSIILSFRNIFIDAYNKAIHKELTGSSKIVEGQKLVLNSPLLRQVYNTDSPIKNSETFEIIANNGDLINVKMIHKTQPVNGIIMDVNYSDIDNEKNNETETYLFLTRAQWSAPSFVYNLWNSAWKNIMRWKQFKYFAMNASLPYATTVHKSQGSTYDNVGVNIQDINNAWTDDDRYRMLYVAFSRAKNKCYVKL